MFNRLSKILSAKFNRKDDLSKQIEIVKVFDIYREEVKKILPNGEAAKPISLRNKVLSIQVPNSVAANELRLREHEIIFTINTKLRPETIKRILYRF